MMDKTIINNNKISLDKEYFVGLEKKAAFLDELLSFIEDKSLGYLMKGTEKEENIPLFKVKKIEW